MKKTFNGHWDSLGNGPPILCISGFASGNWMYRPLAQTLADRHTSILPDNRGMGLSPPATQPYTLDDLAGDVIALMDQLEHETFTLIGLSMGGFIAQLIAARHPERVKRLVLMCTSSNDAAFKGLFPMLSREQISAIYMLRREERVRAALSETFCPFLFNRYPDTHAYILEHRLRFEPESAQVLLQYDAVARFFASEPVPLERLTMPTLILSGALDLVVPSVNAQMLASRIPNAQARIIDETDHLFFLEKSAEVNGLIRDFLGAP
ncbi:Cis-3-alkyl-4-alkyloxetan-2-one decarboxylase [Candidatus Magnetaquicoccaceae bacterium FCR-1]|uniref:Cis-3-alkyl-4-alkyloxetan-2-one decarboxylase n=1 Tax=Candidatus Magnetaquiglobus chichijimensis TaxID=3141448 RepID=A0ABQ0C9U9_9PROT